MHCFYYALHFVAAELMAKHNVRESDCCKEFPSQGSYPDPIGE